MLAEKADGGRHAAMLSGRVVVRYLVGGCPAGRIMGQKGCERGTMGHIGVATELDDVWVIGKVRGKKAICVEYWGGFG